MINQSGEGFTENTLFKVYDVLRDIGLDETKARDAINEMQNKGILFRERIDQAKAKPVLRGRVGRRLVDEEDDE